ncbi:unannotated protein [freshwater metagenome]|uniref:Unannotated protein n=1 Tax=freshwater metagenome TaxID=449393 RepID=A0A6J6BFZ7_9ZZZZ
MFDNSQISIMVRKRLSFSTSDIATLRQSGDCREGIADANCFVIFAVYQLQQLHGELDIAQTAWTQLDLNIPELGGDILGYSLAHLLDRLNETFTSRARPHHVRECGEVVGAERGITGHRSRFEHGLKLPVLGPPLVVCHV